MKFYVAIYYETGKHAGTTCLDSDIDHINNRPIASYQDAQAYTDQYLKTDGQYAAIIKI